MIDYQNLRLFHQHGSEWGELRPREPHDAADLDPEQRFGAHPRFFRCDRCEDDILVVESDQAPGDPVPR